MDHSFCMEDMLDTINSATHCNDMPPPSAKLCRHPVQRYATTELIAESVCKSIIRAGGVRGNSILLKTPFFQVQRGGCGATAATIAIGSLKQRSRCRSATASLRLCDPRPPFAEAQVEPVPQIGPLVFATTVPPLRHHRRTLRPAK